MNAKVLLVSVLVLGATLLGCVAWIGVLALNGVPVPDVLQNIAVGSMTGLVGLLVQTKPESP